MLEGEETMAKKILKIIGIVLLTVVLLAVVLAAIWHNAAAAMFYNLTAKTYELDESTDWSGGQTYLKVPYAEASDEEYVDIYVPDDVENPPLIVLVHGGGFITNDSQARQTQWMYRYFRDHGYACASINYRLADEAEFPGALEDVKACIRFLKANADTYGFDAERVAIFGESAGAYLAIMATVTNDEQFSDLKFIGEDDLETTYSAEVNVLVDFYGTAEMGQYAEYWEELGYPTIMIEIANSWIRGEAIHGYETSHSWWIRKNESELSEEERAYYSAYTYMEENISADSDLAVWISHGDADITVPIQCSEKLYGVMSSVLGEDRTMLNIVPHAGHAGDSMYTDEELAKIEAFLAENL